jgi:hypothetical protein
MFAVLQNRRLNQHIVYTVVDEVGVCVALMLPTYSEPFVQVFAALFPESSVGT